MLRFAIVATALAVASGCAQMAPHYNPSVENIQKLRDSGAGTAKVATLEPKLVAGQKNDSIQLRASSMESPYGGTFTGYLEAALKAELAAARLLDDRSDVEIGGLVTKNDVSVANLSEGYGEIEVRVIVKRGSQVRYDKVKYTRTTFESGFLGAIAIPNGRAAYPDLVQKFFAGLYADADFIAALK